MNQANPARPVIPDHELIQPIGKGSYGEVWLARSMLGTLRAVKIVRRDSFSNARPFERELEGIQHVEPLSRGHEGLVDILHVGRGADDSFFYYVMELADPISGTEIIPRGEASKPYSPRSLGSDLAMRGSLSVPECIELFQNIAMALAHLHRAGLVHRDIKPSNIIFVEGFPKLADIGLVAAADDAPSYVGTEGFIPPEGAGTVGADIYSLGKVLYEAGTGLDRSDFPALPKEAADLEASRGLMELNAIWLKACATAPADRYQSVDEMAAELSLLRAGQSVKRLRVVESRLQRARQLAGFAGMVALIILIGWGIAKREADTERTSRVTADELRKRAQLAEHEARDALSEARVAQIRAILQSKSIGRRASALSLLTNGISPKYRVTARSLAAMALALPDLVEDSAPGLPPGPLRARAEPQADGSLRITLKSGETRILPPTGEPFREVLEVSGDDRFLYAGYGRFTERIWDLSNAAMLARLDTNYYHLAFRPNHQEVAIAYVSGEVVLHQLPGWQTNRIWPGMAGQKLSWNQQGDRLMIATEENEVRVLKVESGVGKSLGKLSAHIMSTAWHQDGRHIAVSADDGYVRVQDIESWPEYVILARHEGQIVSANFLPPFPWLLTSSWDGTSRLWDWQAGQELGRMEATSYEIAYDESTRRLQMRMGSDHSASGWRLTGGEVWRQFFHGNPRATGGPFMSRFSGDSRWVASADNEGIRVWNILTGDEALFLPIYSQAIWFNQDGTRLMANGNGAIRQWQLTEGANHQLNAVEEKQLGQVHYEGRLAASDDGNILSWIDGPNLIVLNHGVKISWQHEQELPEALAMSPDGRQVAIGTRNHVGARIFDTTDGRLLWKTDAGHGTHLSFSADSEWLAVGTDSGCHIFASRTGKLRWSSLPTAQEKPTSWEIAFSPDGALVAWTPKPSEVRVMNAVDGSEVLTLDYPTRRYITGLTFSPDGRWLAESSNKHVLHLWDLKEINKELGRFKLEW